MEFSGTQAVVMLDDFCVPGDILRAKGKYILDQGVDGVLYHKDIYDVPVQVPCKIYEHIDKKELPKEWKPHLTSPAEVLKLVDSEQEEGLKFDEGKLLFSLVPPEVIKLLTHVLTFGAKKYKPDNWKNVEPFQERYQNAMMRHENARLQGEIFDPETGILTIGHELTNLVFLAWKQIEEHGYTKDEKEND